MAKTMGFSMATMTVVIPMIISLPGVSVTLSIKFGLSNFPMLQMQNFLDPDVSLDDPQCHIKDNGIGDDAINEKRGGDGGHLSHSLASGLAPTEFSFVAAVGEVGFDAKEEGGVSNAEAVADHENHDKNLE